MSHSPSRFHPNLRPRRLGSIRQILLRARLIRICRHHRLLLPRLVPRIVVIHLPRAVGVARLRRRPVVAALLRPAALVPEAAGALVGLSELGAADSFLVGGEEGAEHGDADAEDGEVGFEDEEEDGCRHRSGDVVDEVDG